MIEEADLTLAQAEVQRLKWLVEALSSRLSHYEQNPTSSSSPRAHMHPHSSPAGHNVYSHSHNHSPSGDYSDVDDGPTDNDSYPPPQAPPSSGWRPRAPIRTVSAPSSAQVNKTRKRMAPYPAPRVSPASTAAPRAPSYHGYSFPPSAYPTFPATPVVGAPTPRQAHFFTPDSPPKMVSAAVEGLNADPTAQEADCYVGLTHLPTPPSNGAPMPTFANSTTPLPLPSSTLAPALPAGISTPYISPYQTMLHQVDTPSHAHAHGGSGLHPLPYPAEDSASFDSFARLDDQQHHAHGGPIDPALMYEDEFDAFADYSAYAIVDDPTDALALGLGVTDLTAAP